MPFDSIICRKKLDEERGNIPSICECPLCQEARREENGGLLHGDGISESLRSEPKNDLPEAMGEGDTGLQGGNGLEDCKEGYYLAEEVNIFLPCYVQMRPKISLDFSFRMCI